MIESSRFCVDTSLATTRGKSLHEATLTMLAGIIEWSIANHYSEIVTVTDTRFERILSRASWPLQRIGQPRMIGEVMSVAGTLPVDRASFLRVRSPRYRSEIAGLQRSQPDGRMEDPMVQLRSHPRSSANCRKRWATSSAPRSTTRRSSR